MRGENYQLIFYNILLIFIFFMNIWIFLFIIVANLQQRHHINLESDTEYEFDFINASKNEIDDYNENEYLEFDIDNDEFYTLRHEEIYLISNCKFFFDSYGGDLILDFSDFTDIKIYNINNLRNLKYISNKGNSYEKDIEINDHLFDFINDYFKDYNTKFYLELLNKEDEENFNKDLYIIVKNNELIEKCNKEKRHILIKINKEKK